MRSSDHYVSRHSMCTKGGKLHMGSIGVLVASSGAGDCVALV